MPKGVQFPADGCQSSNAGGIQQAEHKEGVSVKGENMLARLGEPSGPTARTDRVLITTSFAVKPVIKDVTVCQEPKPKGAKMGAITLPNWAIMLLPESTM